MAASITIIVLYHDGEDTDDSDIEVEHDAESESDGDVYAEEL